MTNRKHKRNAALNKSFHGWKYECTLVYSMYICIDVSMNVQYVCMDVRIYVQYVHCPVCTLCMDVSMNVQYVCMYVITMKSS